MRDFYLLDHFLFMLRMSTECPSCTHSGRKDSEGTKDMQRLWLWVWEAGVQMQ